MLKRFHKKTKYRMSIVVILALLFQVLIPIGSNVAFAAVKRDVIDSVEITNEQGETQNSFRPMDRIRIDVKWSIKSNVKAGDTFNFQLPSQLRGFNGTIYLNDDNGNNFGIGKGSGNSIVFKFSDNVEKYDNISGFFYVQTEIKYIEQQGEVFVPLVFKVNGKVICKKIIIVDTGTNTGGAPGEIAEVFYKCGTIDPNDDTLINWALRINYKGDILYDTIVIDVLGDGHELVDGSLSVYEGYTNYATGEIENLTNVSLDHITDCGFSSKSFGLRFDIRGDYYHHYCLKQGQSYMVYYQTRIIDDQDTYENEATLSAWNREPIVRKIQVQSFSSGGGASGGKIEPIVEKIEITGTKVWEGDSEEDRPDIELQLYRDGEAFGESITLESGKSEYTWTDLDKTDETGREYTYTVDEVEVPEGYEKSISEDGLTITNTYIVEQPVVEEPDEPEEPKEEPIEPEQPEQPEEEPTVEEPAEPEKPVEDPEDSIIVEDDDVPLAGVDEEPTEPDQPVVEEPEIPTEDPNDELIVEEPEQLEEEPKDEDSVIVEDNDVPMGDIEGPMDILPKTGEGSRQIFYLSGLLLILIGIISKRRV